MSLLDGLRNGYECAYGRFASVLCRAPLFLAIIGLADDADFQRADGALVLAIAMGDDSMRLFRAASPRPWTAIFEGTDACVAPALDPVESAAEPHMAARGNWLDIGGRRQPRRPAFRTSGTHAR